MSNVLSKRLQAAVQNTTIRRFFIVLVALLLLYSLIGFVALPWIIKSQAQTLFAEKLHRRGSVGEVKVNPFSLVVILRDFKLMEPQSDSTFASFDALTVNLSTESVLRLAPVIQQVRLDKPYVHLARTAPYRYNIDDLIELATREPSSQQTARFAVNNIRIENGRIEFHDEPEKSSHAVTDLSLGIPFISSLPSQVNIFVEPLLRMRVDGSPLEVKGKARPFAEKRDAVVDLNLDDLDVTRYLAYLPFEPGFKLRSGRLDTRLSINFQQPKNEAPLLLLSGTASLKSAQLAEHNGAPVIKLPELAVALGSTNVFNGPITLTKVVLNGLETELTRERDGRLNLQRLLPAPPSRQAAKAASRSAPLRIALDELEIRNAALHYTDEYGTRPTRAGIEKFALKVHKLAIDTGKKSVHADEIVSDKAALFLLQGKAGTKVASPKQESVTSPKKAGAAYAVSVDRLRIDNWSARLEDQRAPEPIVTTIAPLSLSVQDMSTAAAAPARLALKATVNKSGRLGANGTLGLAPFHTDLALDVNGVDILPLQPLVEDKINLQVTRASLSSKGKLQLDTAQDGSLKGGFKGDASLNNLATIDETNGNDFLRWKSLSAEGMDMRFAPFALTVDKLALMEFFARIIIDPSGRINLQDIARGDSGERKSLTAAGEARASAPQPSAAAASQHTMPPISIRKLTFDGGRVRFSDNFIKPNYSASLTNLGGVVAGLSSDPSSSAGVDLHGEVNRAPLSIVGRIHPLRKDLLLDLKANVRGMELADLSPYADRYIGYGIEKGKLSFEVAYHVENRQLSAANRLILDQLTLSEQSASSAATKLPVKLAIALLQDRDGVIDVNVPVEGSLDDPQFSVGGIVLKIIGNAIVKAVSKPFALLGSVFSGSSSAELSSLPFEPGRAVVRPTAEPTLNTLAKALANRPALKLEITGWADRKADYEGLKRAAIDRKMRALKQKDLQAKGQFVEMSGIAVTPDEYPSLLARVYKEEQFQKPRNAIGLPKSLPEAEMENLIKANTTINDDDLNLLANRRAQAVKDWLLKFGKIPGERIFILASKSGQQEAKEGGNASPLSKVDFSLR